jgi:hypothetical protein
MKERPILFSGPMVRAILSGAKTQTRRVIRLDRPCVQLPREVRSEPMIFAVGQGASLPAGAYRATMNPQGAVCGVSADGKVTLGLKPGEFHWRCPYADGETVLVDHQWRIFPRGDSHLWVREAFWQVSSYPGAMPSGEPFPQSYCWGSLIQYAADGNPPNTPNKHYPEGLTGGGISAPDPYASWHKRPSIHLPRRRSRITLEVTSIRVERLQAITEADARAEGIHGWSKDRALYKWAPADHEGDGPCWPWVDCPKTAQEAYVRLWDEINGARAPWASNPWVWVVEFKRLVSGG